MERGLFELHEDPEAGGKLVWTRRRFIAGGVVAGMERALSAAIPYGRFLPAGMIPVAIADSPPGTVIADKPGLRVLNDRPFNAETPAHLLDDEITPAERLFVRNNGVPPAAVDPGTWQLSVAGEACLGPRTFSLEELKREFPHYTYRLQLECGGNGRSEFRPRVPGNQWTTGAIGCPEWTGVRLKDVLERGRDQYGMQSFDQHLTELYRSGVVELEVARAAASNPSDFERALSFGSGEAFPSSGDEEEPEADLDQPSFVDHDEKPDEDGEILELSSEVADEPLELA